ncbi:MAG: hypothetical protein EU530_11675 [Promethearchaeota archaeon]|nr:MAG: hypothetical protein EU530_11675 [Candidatus Lokiarchaeota archaeon]
MDENKENIGAMKDSETAESRRSLSPDELEMFSRVEKKLQSELTPETTSEDKEDGEKDRTLYTYCTQCQDNIFIHYKESFVKNAKSYPVYLVWVHGKPFHGLLVRIDKNFVSRGERVVHLEFDSELSNHYG